MEIDKKIRYHVLDIAQGLNLFIQHGKDPVEGLDFLLEYYQEVPEAQKEIRKIIKVALVKYNNLES
jgi:hypothetical protein